MQSQPDDTAKIQAYVQSRFAPVAEAYITSATHAQGADLSHMLALAALCGSEQVLDVATGGGHTALAFAPLVRHVIASDLTWQMLTTARQHITAQGITNVGYCRALAESLPFAAARFDRVTCRLAAHHFADIQAFVREAAHVMRPDALLLIADHIGLDDPDLDAFMDRFERWRDPSHVRAYTLAEWSSMLTSVGLEIEHSEQRMGEPYEFTSWTARMRMPDAECTHLERWLLEAPAPYRTFFDIIGANGRIISLRSHFGVIMARKSSR